jgi:hypothetical protein
MPNKLLVFIVAFVLLSSCVHYQKVYYPEKGGRFGNESSYIKNTWELLNIHDTMALNEKKLTAKGKIVKIIKSKYVNIVKVQLYSVHYYFTFSDSIIFSGTADSLICDVVSLNIGHVHGIKKICKGKIYDFLLLPYFKYECDAHGIVREVILNGCPFGINTVRSNIYTTPNLQGLYYVSSPPEEIAQWANVVRVPEKVYQKYRKKYLSVKTKHGRIFYE